MGQKVICTSFGNGKKHDFKLFIHVTQPLVRAHNMSNLCQQDKPPQSPQSAQREGLKIESLSVHSVGSVVYNVL